MESIVVSMQHTGSNGISSLHPRVSTCTFNFDYNNLLMSGPSVNILKSNFKSNHFPAWHQLFHYKGFLHWHEQKILESKYLAELDFRCYSVVVSSKSNVNKFSDVLMSFRSSFWTTGPSPYLTTYDVLVCPIENFLLDKTQTFFWLTCQKCDMNPMKNLLQLF